MALEFQVNTSGQVGRADFAWTVNHVLGIKLDPKIVSFLLCLDAYVEAGVQAMLMDSLWSCCGVAVA